MPARGGAFFGFAIIVAAALITWGIIALVDVADDDSSDDSGSRSASSLQDALDNVSPGETIEIPEGTHEVSLTTTVSGTESEPITITCAGSSREDCILKGDGNARVLEILHSWYIIEEFTIDGQDPEDDDEFKEQLIFVQGTGEPSSVNGVDTAVTGIIIRGMNLFNAGKECIRFRYFVTNSVVDECLIGPCGKEDYVVAPNSDGNGEGVYIGTAITQIYMKDDEYPQLDVCTGIVVMNSRIDTQGSEGVDIKEGSYGNIVYRNEISGQSDSASGGVSLRGNNNYVYFNKMIDGLGPCVRIGGGEHDSDSTDSTEATDYGKNNEVYQNRFDSCRYSAVKVNETPQLICENFVEETTVVEGDGQDPYDADYAIVRGDAAASFPVDLVTAVSCDEVATAPTTVSDHVRIGDRFDFDWVDGSTEAEEDSDEEEEASDVNRSIVIDDDSVEENDDEIEAGAAVFEENSYAYVGCYFLNSQSPGEMFDEIPLDGDADMSVEKCILACVDMNLEYAAIQNGSQCWCGDDDEFDQHGTGLCNIDCTGSEDDACGGVVSFSLWQINGDGGIDPDDVVAGEANTATPAPAAAAVTEQPVEQGSVVVVDQGEEEAPAEDEAEEDDDDAPAVEPTGDYMGCYRDSDNDPILSFLYEDEHTLTPASCIDSCRAEGESMAGVQNGSQCWCGTTDDYDRYGTVTCSMSCSGDPSQTCGASSAASVWTVDEVRL